MPFPDDPPAPDPASPIDFPALAATPTPERQAEAIGRLRACAIAVRAAADTIDRSLDDVRAYDRDDVWQGGRATAFRDGLLEQITLLTSANLGATTRLRDSARRIDVRADAVQAEVDAAFRAALAVGSVVVLPY